MEYISGKYVANANGVWLSIPDCDGQILANRNGCFRHSLSGYEFHIEIEFPNRDGPSSWHPRAHDGPVPFDDLCEVGGQLYSLLRDSGCPLHVNDASIVCQWLGTRVFTMQRGQLLFEESLDLEKRRKEYWKHFWDLSRPGRDAERAATKERVRARAEGSAARRAFEESEMFREMFLVVYGKRLEDLGPEDQQVIIYSAKLVAETRLLRANPHLKIPSRVKGKISSGPSARREPPVPAPPADRQKA